jgi:branched-chain amino acid transport system ATP-binding protein
VAEAPLLEVRGVSKSFGGLKALSDVGLTLHEGEILGLIGPNGAGKTTLFNVVAGVQRPDRGGVLFRGRPIDRLGPHERCRLGIARTFQITKPFPAFTVLENAMVGALFGHRTRESAHRPSGGPRPAGRIAASAAAAEARERARRALASVGLSARADALASALTIGERKRLEMARALATEPEVLMLDEVVAGLSPVEVDEMMGAIRGLNAKGLAILMIEHVMRAVMGVSRRIVVLHYGQKLAEGSPAEVAANERVVEAYLGRRRRPTA